MSLNKDLLKTLKTSDLKDVTKDITESGIDLLIKNEILKEIPIIKSIVGVFKLGISIKDMFFLKKLLRFLNEINDTTLEERANIINKIEQNPQYTHNLGENLILLIDKLDDLDKANIIGKLFKSVLEQRIDIITFQRICHAVNGIFIHDIYELHKLWKGENIVHDIKNNLFIYGFMKRKSFGQVALDGSNEFEINSLGKILIEELYNH
ncbi:hypothetical protein AD998_15615 [bacterium 336/3]|nr:hypothetical protein AD998_15615 [bacterium 336/3]